MSGFVGNLSPQQEDALREVAITTTFRKIKLWAVWHIIACIVVYFLQLRSALHDVEEVADKDDHYFLRWLRARKFNVAQAEDMLRKVGINSY